MIQNNLSVARYDDLWIGDGSLRKHNEIGAGIPSKFFDLFKERPKIRASHVSIKQEEKTHAFVC